LFSVLLFVFSTLIAPFFSGVIGCGSAYVILRITRAHNERKAGEGDEKTWRESRLAAESSLRNEIQALGSQLAGGKKATDSERMQDKLKFESDLAMFANNLSRLADVADTLTTMTERVGWHGKEIERHERQISQVHDDLDSIRKDINSLYRAK
jgi:hypothetical protein